MNFDTAFHKVLGHEGGYSNHPADKGGETMWGITHAVAKANGYYGDMKELPVEFAKKVYKKDYWDAVSADLLPPTVRFHVFDAAVNSGVTRAARWLQMVVGAEPDGKIGPKTLAAVNQQNPAAIVAKYSATRLKFMASLPNWPEFGRGWARRISDNLENV